MKRDEASGLQREMRRRLECPVHHHRLKKETFYMLSGTVQLWAESEIIYLLPGQQYTLNPGVRHRFSSVSGAVIEEVSTHDQDSDSYFDDPTIVRDPANNVRRAKQAENGREG